MNAAVAVARKMKDVKVSERELFTSTYFAVYLQNVVSPICKEYGRRVPKIILQWHTDADAPAAYTDDISVYINIACSLVQENETREMKLFAILGLLTHELGHYFFTDFPMDLATSMHMERGRWYPTITFDEDRETDLVVKDLEFWEWVESHPTKCDSLVQCFLNLSNIIEDGYIEECDYRAMAGQLTDGLSLNRHNQMTGAFTVKDYRAKIDLSTAVARLRVVEDLLLIYAKYGRIKYDPSDPEDKEFEPLIALRSVMRYVDDVIYETNSTKRARGKIRIFLSLWPFYKAALEENPDDASSERKSKMTSKRGKGKTKGSAVRKAKSDDGDESDDSESTDSMRRTTPRPSDEGESSEKSSSKGKSDDESGEESDKDDGSDGSGGDKKSEDREESDGDKVEDSDDESSSKGGDKGSSGKDDIFTPSLPAEDPKEEEFGVPTDSLDKIESDLRRIAKKALEDKALAEVDKDLTAEIADEAKKIDFGGAHTGLTTTIYRPCHSVTPDMIAAYDRVAGPYEAIAAEMARKLGFLRRIDPNPISMNGFFTGSRFDASRLVLGDMKYFRQDTIPAPQNGVVISILNDESGSMSGDDRIESARAASLAVYLFAQMCDIKCSVMGHTASFERDKDLVMDVFADYDTADAYDKYRILGISAQKHNRDGAAITFAGEHLLKRPEKTKLMIVISDGQPYAVNYYGHSAIADTAASVKELRRKGVIVFAAAIGSDKPAIQSIFGEGFIDITNLKTLPEQMLNLVKRYVRNR